MTKSFCDAEYVILDDAAVELVSGGSLSLEPIIQPIKPPYYTLPVEPPYYTLPVEPVLVK
jgi:hypothetical protein